MAHWIVLGIILLLVIIFRKELIGAGKVIIFALGLIWAITIILQYLH